MLPLSVLDLSPVVSGVTPAESLRRSIDLARHVDHLGYARYWTAEHHAIASVASPAPEILIGQVAAVTQTIREQFGYDAYTRDTLIRLAEDHITYTEQSNSLKKMQQRFDPAQLAAVTAQAKQLRPDLAAQLDGLVMKHLVMINTREFGERGASPSGDALAKDDVSDPKRSDDAKFHRAVADAVKQASRSDAAGMDIAGPEHFLFDRLGAERFKYLYDQLGAAALARGEPLVLRPHVGEGANDVAPGEPYGFRRVTLMCGDKVLSEADNWYLPARLTPQMNQVLDTSDTPFGLAVKALDFHRTTLDAQAVNDPRTILRVRALLLTPDGAPFSLVVENYTRDLEGPAP